MKKFLSKSHVNGQHLRKEIGDYFKFTMRVFYFRNSSIMIKIGILLAGLYILASLIIPIVLLSYPTIVKHIVFMNMSL
jgi:hypothetical protein